MDFVEQPTFTLRPAQGEREHIRIHDNSPFMLSPWKHGWLAALS
jgi:hypothetical protein